jgi:hypothetical protein
MLFASSAYCSAFIGCQAVEHDGQSLNWLVSGRGGRKCSRTGKRSTGADRRCSAEDEDKARRRIRMQRVLHEIGPRLNLAAGVEVEVGEVEVSRSNVTGDADSRRAPR